MIFSSRTTQKRVAALLLIVFSAGLISFAQPNLAFAQSSENTYYDGPSFEELFEKYAEQCATAAVLEIVASAVLSANPLSVPVTDWGEKIIKLIKNCLVNATKFALLELITGQAVGWAQRGYGGNPSFVQNISQYLLSIADSVAGSYIEQTTAGQFLCSPFRAEIQLALTRYYQSQSGRLFPFGQSSCTLTDIASNVDAFLAGDFYAGGWGAWIEMSSNPYNTPYGAYLETTAQLDREIAKATAEAEKKLDFASGFLSKETQNCYETQETLEDGTVVTFQECDPPQVVTPGETVKSSLEKAFGVKLDTIVAADELNEIMSLVAVYLLTDVLTEEEGLTGYNYTQEFEEPLIDIEDPNDYPGGGGALDPDPAPGQAGNSVCFNLGTFTPTPAEPNTVLRMTLPNNRFYKKILVEMDIVNNGWYGGSDVHHSIMYLTRDNSWGSTFGYVWAGNQDGALIRQRVSTGDVQERHRNYELPVGTNRFVYTFDTNANTRGSSVKIGNRTTLAGPAVTLESINTGTKDFFIELGFNDNSPNPAEQPSMNWVYRDVKVKFLEAGDNDVSCNQQNPD